MEVSKSKIVFLGTPEFAMPILQALIGNNYKLALVITQPDKPAGRKQELIPPPIKVLAQKNNLAIAQPNNKKELAAIFEQNKFDLAVLAAYGMIIPDEILTKPKFGFLNIHPSLLPKYRGSSPIQSAILTGDKKTGVSIIQLAKKIDAGPIVAQAETEIEPQDNVEILSQKLAELGGQLLIETIPGYLKGEVKLRPQNETEATFTKMIEREDGLINWQKTASQIERQFRAFYPWPGVFTHLAGKRLKIANLGVLEGDFKPNLGPGTVFLGPNQTLAVKCGQGAVELKAVQLEGKKELLGKEFLRGQKELIGKILE
ncbi:MAG: methionyl-tRNA formyltransferase [Patescibacteria group bacterium]